jgi:hypothetical protein
MPGVGMRCCSRRSHGVLLPDCGTAAASDSQSCSSRWDRSQRRRPVAFGGLPGDVGADSDRHHGPAERGLETGGNSQPPGCAQGPLGTLASGAFLLATHHGYLSISGILVSLHSAATGLLATAILKERIHPLRGIGLALCAVAYISAG